MRLGVLPGKFINPLAAIIAVEILGVALMMIGVLPREAALFLLGIFVFFVIFAPLKHAALFAVFSIPFYTALPISESFDSMAAWRVIVAILFLRFLGYEIRNYYEYTKRRGSFLSYIRIFFVFRSLLSRLIRTRLGIFVSLFFTLGTLSLIIAPEPVFGIRKLLFLANIFVLFFVIREVVKNKQDFVDVLKFAFAGSALSLAVAYAQFITILFVPLYTFWQWWASHVIPVFYGANLGNLLSYSNTWFSYYEEAEATLRVFSIFPDSHSFALAMVLVLPMALTFLSMKKWRVFFAGTTALILLAIIFSGTRGVWVGAIPVASIMLVFCISKLFIRRPPLLTKERGIGGVVVRAGLIVFLAFALLFPVSSQLLKFSQMRQGGIVSEATFERVSTSFSTRELSNLGRIQIWKSTFDSIARRPFLGVGIGNYPVVLNENVSATKEGASAHSLYLDVASEMGILGGMLLLLIFLEILWRAIQTYRKNQDPFIAAFAGFFAVYLLWVMAYSAVDVVLLNDKVLLTFVALVTMLYTIPGERIVKT